MTLNNYEIAKQMSMAAQDKKAQDVLTLEIKDISSIADYFVICSAQSAVQAQAIADNIVEQLEKQDLKPLRQEGYRNANWILLDYGDVVAHIFQKDDRSFYNIEQLWGDAPSV